MDTTVKESPIIQKALELCQVVANEPDFLSIKERVDAFMGNELVKFQFQQFNELSDMLQMRQQGGMAINEDEIAQFETLRGELLNNPVATGFLEARQEMQNIHEAIGKFVNKTFELGRKPEFEDVFDGSCGSGCGCH